MKKHFILILSTSIFIGCNQNPKEGTISKIDSVIPEKLVEVDTIPKIVKDSIIKTPIHSPTKQKTKNVNSELRKKVSKYLMYCQSTNPKFYSMICWDLEALSETKGFENLASKNVIEIGRMFSQVENDETLFNQVLFSIYNRNYARYDYSMRYIHYFENALADNFFLTEKEIKIVEEKMLVFYEKWMTDNHDFSAEPENH